MGPCALAALRAGGERDGGFRTWLPLMCFNLISSDIGAEVVDCNTR